MASKKTGTKKRPLNARSLKTVRELTRKARAELATLLRQNQRGTITRTKLQSGMRELQTKLEKMFIFEFRI